MLDNTLLRTRLNKYGYYETTTTPGLWRHKWSPIIFVLIVYDFSIEYVGDNHLKHIQTALTNHYMITEDLDGMFLLVSTSNGTMQQNTPNAHVDFPWMVISTTCSSSLDTKHPPNQNSPRTATAKLFTAPKSSSRQKRTPAPNSPMRA